MFSQNVSSDVYKRQEVTAEDLAGLKKAEIVAGLRAEEPDEYEEIRRKKNEYQNAYYHRHKEQYKKYKADYYRKNKERIMAYQKEYYEKKKAKKKALKNQGIQG